MRRNRLIVLGLLILAVIGISVKGGPVTYGFFFFVLITPVVAFLYSLIIFFRFKIYQKLETKVVVANSPAAFYFTLQNEDYFAHSGIRVELFSDFSTVTGIDDRAEYELMPHTGVKREALLVCRYRGEYEVGVKNVTVTDYLRLFPVTFKNRETLKVTVMPRLEILDDITYLDDLSMSSGDQNNEDTEPDVLTREYVPGDDPKYINWKVTARTGIPMVKKRIGENTPGISLIMDSLRYSTDPKDYLPLENRIVELVLALSYYFLDRNIRTGVHAYDRRYIRFAMDGINEFETFYNALSGFGFDTDSSAGLLFDALSGDREIISSTAVIMILHKWSKEAAVFANRLDDYQIPVLVYLVTDDPADVPDTQDLKNVGFRTIGCEDRLKEVL